MILNYLKLLTTKRSHLSTWSTSSGLNFNELKTNCQTVSRKRSPLIHEYAVNGKPIGRLDEERDLGVRVTNTLSWKSQVVAQTSAANKALGCVRRSVSNINDVNVRRTLYLAIVFAHILGMPLKFGPHNQLTLLDVLKGSSVVLPKSS